MRERRCERRRLAAAVVVLALGALLAACDVGVEDVTTTPGASAAPVATGSATAANGPSTPSPSDPVTGSFRRGGVPVPPDLLSTAVSTCKSLPAPPYAEDIGARPVVVSDMRGEGVIIVVFADADGATGCRVTLRDDGPKASLFDVAATTDHPLDEGEITLGAYELDEDGSSERTIAVGQYGDRVVKVRAGFDDDTYVTSSTDNGWYAMWWAGSVRPAVIVAADNRNEARGKLTPPTGPAEP